MTSLLVSAAIAVATFVFAVGGVLVIDLIGWGDEHDHDAELM